MSSFSTFNPPQGRENYHQVLIRPGWLVRLANLGKLAGEEHTLIGAATDFSPHEAGISYGVLTGSERAAIESTLGATLAKVMADARNIRATSITRPAPQRLMAVEPAPVEQETASLHSFGEAMRESNALRAHAAGVRFAQQREDALKLRLPGWNITEMDHRQDWPAWLPEFARELVREHSRTWLELPTAPKGFATPQLPPPLPVPAQRTRHQTMPQTAGGLR